MKENQTLYHCNQCNLDFKTLVKFRSHLEPYGHAPLKMLIDVKIIGKEDIKSCPLGRKE